MPGKFKQGDQVVWTCHSKPDFVGRVATVVREAHRVNYALRLRFNDFDPNSLRDLSDTEFRSAFERRVEMYHATLDFSKPLATRDGRPVRYVGKSGDPERPHLVMVPFDHGEMALSFLPDGHFYKSINQDYDLVNT